jgi:hypothetical protein
LKKYYEILGLKQGATKQDIKIAFNKLSKELDPKKNDNQDFFIEETKKLKVAYDKLMNSSILSSKRIKESKQNDDSQDNNKKSEKENTDPPTNEKSNFMKTLKEISVAVLSIAMIKVITQLLAFPSGYIDFGEIFIIYSETSYGYDFSFIVFLFSVFLYLFLRFVLLMSFKKIITKTFYVFLIIILLQKYFDALG